MFEGHTPGDTVRCPIQGCEFAGTVGQVAAHAAETGDADHDRLERRIERARSAPGASGGRDHQGDGTPVAEFLRLFEAAYGERAGYESGSGGGWLFPFEDG